LLEVSISRKLRDFELKVGLQSQPGEILVMTGKNGAGKSTSLNLIAGLMAPDAGHIRLKDRVLYDTCSGTHIPAEERQIGYVFQNAAIFPHLSVRENIAYGLRARGMDRMTVERQVTRLIDRLNLGHLDACRADRLSGGQRQMVALARAMAIEPDLLLLDEPFRALDESARSAVRSCINDVVESLQIPCILVTHNLSDLNGKNSRICTVENGKVQMDTVPEIWIIRSDLSSGKA
jgi:molybdate transport system ATP-binding protein